MLYERYIKGMPYFQPHLDMPMHQESNPGQSSLVSEVMVSYGYGSVQIMLKLPRRSALSLIHRMIRSSIDLPVIWILRGVAVAKRLHNIGQLAVFPTYKDCALATVVFDNRSHAVRVVSVTAGINRETKILR